MTKTAPGTAQRLPTSNKLFIKAGYGANSNDMIGSHHGFIKVSLDFERPTNVSKAQAIRRDL